MAAQRADALITYEPVKSRLLQAGAHVLYSSARIPDRIVDVLVVRRTALAQHSAAVQALVAAHFKALALWRSKPEQYADLMASRMGLSPEQVAASFAELRLPDALENRSLLSGAQPPVAATAQRLTDIMWAAGLLAQKPELSGLLEPRYLP